MSCKYCELKMRSIDEDTKELRGESWKDEYGASGYIGQMYDDKFRMTVYYSDGCTYTTIDNIKYCPFCGGELTMPEEPLIKDPKVRKAIRAWAEVNKIEDNEKVEYKGLYWKLYYSTVGSATIQFNVPLRVADGSYTITELCGEEGE